MTNAREGEGGRILKRKRRCAMQLSTAAFTFGLLLVVPAGWATAVEKHSGVVVAADETKITIDEMGPWHGPATQPTRRTYQRTRGTRIVLAERTREGAGGFPWAFNDETAQRADPRAGDFVTVTAEPRGAGQVATDVVVVWPGTHLEIPGSSAR
jgi:hypothetical protein